MAKSKSLIIGIFALVIALILGVVLVIKDSSELVSAKEAERLFLNEKVTDISCDDEYVYFEANAKHYKVYANSLSPRIWSWNFPVVAKKAHFLNDTLGEIGIMILVLLGLAVLFQVMRLIFFKSVSMPSGAKKSEVPRERESPLLESTSHSTTYVPMTSVVRFKDVAGISEVKEELLEIIDYLKKPKYYQELGISLPKGVLLVGPPGVGKTMIAKAVAGEAGVPFFYQSGSSFVQIYVGMGAKRVRELFMRAKAKSPSIIFIDEIDAVGKARGNARSDEREATLNQLLTEMDGFEDSSGVIVIGATNNVESLDDALLRSGRFDRRIFVELPDLQERIKILKVHTRDKTCDFDFEEISKLCVGFSGAALASLINEAALCAIKRGSDTITKEDILNVRDKVMLGVRKKLSFSDKEKEILAYYQAAKAFSAYSLEIPFEKATLMSDGLKSIDKEFLSKNEMESKIKIHLSGIAALELLYQERYSHAKEDLNAAKALARQMVESYGMGEYLLGREEDVLKILEDCKNERLGFFKNYRGILEHIKISLLVNEKLEYHEIGQLIHAQIQK